MKFAGQTALAITAKGHLANAQKLVKTLEGNMTGGTERAQFERLIKQHLDSALQLAMRLTGNPADADDLVQETMLKAVRSWTTFRGQAQFKTWLFRVLINSFRDRIRNSQRKKDTVELDESSDFHDARQSKPETQMETKEMSEVVTRLISQLPQRQREILILASYQAMDHRQISEVVGVSVDNVYSNLSIARKKLKQQLAPFVDRHES